MHPTTRLTALLSAGFASLSVAGYAAETSTNLPVTALKFFDTGIGLQAAPAYGDLKTGRHGTYVKMPAGFVSKPHTHSHDYYAVVISGVGANGKPGATDVPLPAGSYWLQSGKEVHVTKCLSTTDCLFFVVQPGSFDYLIVK